MAWVVYLSNRAEDYVEWEVLGTPDPLNRRDDIRFRQIGREIAERQSKLSHLDPDFAFPSDWPGPVSGYRYPELDPPLRLQVLPKSKVGVPDVALFMASMIVTESVRDKIEAIEPGVHQFLPAEVLLPDGSRDRPRWLLNVCTRADTIAVEQCEDVRDVLLKDYQPRFPGWSKYMTDLSPIRTKLAVHHDKVAGRAIWFEYKLGLAIMADALHDFIVDNRLTGMEWTWGPNPAREV